MPWIKIDDHYDEHPKFAKAGPLGMALWLSGLAYCNRNLTDGFIPWSTARTLVSWEFLSFEGITLQVCIAEDMKVDQDGLADMARPVDSWDIITMLLDAGLWTKEPNGYQVHDYANYQPTKAQVEADRAAKIAAGRAGGKASARARGQAPAQAPAIEPAIEPAQAQSNPVPVPVPVPSVSKETLSGESAFDAYYRLTIKPPSQAVIAWLNRLCDDHPEPTVVKVMVSEWQASSNPADFLGRVQTRLAAIARHQTQASERAAKDRGDREREEERKRAESQTPEQRERIAAFKAEAVASIGKSMP